MQKYLNAGRTQHILDCVGSTWGWGGEKAAELALMWGVFWACLAL